MYTYGWFMLSFDRKQQNSVKQLSFNKKKKKKDDNQSGNSCTGSRSQRREERPTHLSVWISGWNVIS